MCRHNYVTMVYAVHVIITDGPKRCWHPFALLNYAPMHITLLFSFNMHKCVECDFNISNAALASFLA